MRILVCGGRDFTDEELVNRILNQFYNEHGQEYITIIHGGAKGADSLAGKWGKESGVPVEVYPADWKKHGRAAGPIRNKQMLDEGKPDIVIAFKGGKGTRNMITQAKENGFMVVEYNK